MTYVHPGTLLSEIAKEHPEANEQDLLVMLVNKLRELDDLQCWLDVSREWFGSQRQMLEGIRLSPEERAARKDASIERFFKSTPEQREQLKKNKSLS